MPGSRAGSGARSLSVSAGEAGAKEKEILSDVQVSPLQINDNFTVNIHDKRELENNGLQYIILRDGESLETIMKEYGLFRWEIIRFNDMEDGFVPGPGQILYIQHKRNRAESGKEKHTARAGDTMNSVYKTFGVRLNKQKEYNRIPRGSEADEGQVIWLRRVKPSR